MEPVIVRRPRGISINLSLRKYTTTSLLSPELSKANKWRRRKERGRERRRRTRTRWMKNEKGKVQREEERTHM